MIRVIHIHRRPTKRRDCAAGPRPCPWARCQHHLCADLVGKRDSRIRQNHELPWDDLEHTCALDAAEEGGRTLESIGDLSGVGVERVRILQLQAQRKLSAFWEAYYE